LIPVLKLKMVLLFVVEKFVADWRFFAATVFLCFFSDVPEFVWSAFILCGVGIKLAFFVDEVLQLLHLFQKCFQVLIIVHIQSSGHVQQWVDVPQHSISISIVIIVEIEYLCVQHLSAFAFERTVAGLATVGVRVLVLSPDSECPQQFEVGWALPDVQQFSQFEGVSIVDFKHRYFLLEIAQNLCVVD